MRTYGDMIRTEYLAEQPGAGCGGEAPVIRRRFWRVRKPAHGGHGRQQYTTRPKHALSLANGCVDAVNVLERLREDETVEAIGRQSVALSQIGDKGRLRVARVQIENVAALYLIPNRFA